MDFTFLANDLWIIFPLFWIWSISVWISQPRKWHVFPKLPESDGFMVKMSGRLFVNDFNAYWWEKLIIQFNMSHLYESSVLELVEHLFVVVGIGLNCQIRVSRTGGGKITWVRMTIWTGWTRVTVKIGIVPKSVQSGTVKTRRSKSDPILRTSHPSKNGHFPRDWFKSIARLNTEMHEIPFNLYW